MGVGKIMRPPPDPATPPIKETCERAETHMHFRSPILIRYDLRRFEPQAQHCGTTGKALKDETSTIQKQLKKDEDTASLFTKLRERMSALLTRQAEGKQSRQAASQSGQSDQKKRAA